MPEVISHNFGRDMELHGKGGDHDVFRKDSKAFKKRNNVGEYERSRDVTGAEFYFGKIMHLLMPDQVPDIHAIHIPQDPKENMLQSVHDFHDTSVDPVHENSRKKDLGQQVEDQIDSHQQHMIREAAIDVFRQRLSHMGISKFVIDDKPHNFVIDADNNAVYLDQFFPEPDDIDLEKLRLAIEEHITDTTKKNLAIRYINRLQTITDM